MHPSNPPPKALQQLERHKAALIYHQQRPISPPTPQVQQTSSEPLEEPRGRQKHISADLPLSMGNMFQDGITKLPVMYLPEHHLLQIQKLRAKRLKNLQSPVSKKQDVNENGRIEGQKRGGENEPSKIGTLCKNLVPFSNTSRLLQKKLYGLFTHNSSNKLSRETNERRRREQVMKNTQVKTVEMQLHHPADSDKNGIGECDFEIKKWIGMAVKLHATPLVASNNAPDWPLRPSRESGAWI
ncbi:hypothetical protein EYC80_004716 [Monilinia laxa]|uniref:Uncharacterized protein n=1 Tax=Monilinia laxa TaxID=61186 RepID=A0A5N6KHL6_MONLA|nr:hypothetical protein EYC80_004716 [Monilinia laxa]